MLLKISENFQKMSEDRLRTFRHVQIFPKTSEDFRRLPTIFVDLKEN